MLNGRAKLLQLHHGPVLAKIMHINIRPGWTKTRPERVIYSVINMNTRRFFGRQMWRTPEHKRNLMSFVVRSILFLDGFLSRREEKLRTLSPKVTKKKKMCALLNKTLLNIGVKQFFCRGVKSNDSTWFLCFIMLLIRRTTEQRQFHNGTEMWTWNTRVAWKVSDLTKTQVIFSEFFFLYSLLVTLHTYPSDAPISVARPNSIRRFSLQNNCSRGWLPLHLTKISVFRAQNKSLGARSGE